MELSAKYAHTVFMKKSFSAAAKSLFISQPALSAAISRLEADIGFKIFDRGTVPLKLTPEGCIYMDSLEEIIESETVMKQRIRRLSDLSYGTLKVGGSCLAAYHIFAVVCAKFHELYPEIEVEIDMGSIGTHSYLIERMNKHMIDLLVGHKFSPSQYKTTPILEEQYLVAMRRDLLHSAELEKYALTREEVITKQYDASKLVDDMTLFEDVEFLRTSKGSTPNVKIEKLMGDYKIAKCSVKNARHAGMQYNMMRYGLGAIMTSDTILKMFSQGNEDLVFFIPKSPDAKQMLYIAQDMTLTPTTAAENFKNLAIEVCKTGELFSKKYR